MKPMRIALLTHSTNPRGGVAHALALGEALHEIGHAPTVFAPDVSGHGFGRTVHCRTRAFRAKRVDGSLLELVDERIREYAAHFQHRGDEFDVYHAQDGISGNALATLSARGLIGGFFRTVHHLDHFTEPRLSELQDRSVMAARRILCVSEMWAQRIRNRYGTPAAVVSNGLDPGRFSPHSRGTDAVLRHRLGLAQGPIFLAVGGIEARKNSIHILRAFARFHESSPESRLVIAGGATLLDHRAYGIAFDAAMADLGEAVRHAVVRAGVVADEDMPALMRLADALVFPSIKEGFGLVVLEAMACGTPTVVSQIEPFTEYLADGDCAWCDPADVNSIAAGMQRAVADRVRFRDRGLSVAARYPWSAVARKHEALYRSFLQENVHAANAVSSALA